MQKCGHIFHAKLTEAIGSTPSTCLRRVWDLQKLGILTNNIYLADGAKLGRGLRAITTTTTKDHARADSEAFSKPVGAESVIAYAYGVTGEFDAILIGSFQNIVEYQKVCDGFFDRNENIVRYTAYFISEI